MTIPSSTLPLATIVAHERLVPRVAALLRQIERFSVRQRGQAISDTVLGVAKAVFGEGRFVLGRAAPLLPEALTGSDLGVLLAELGAALEGFEASHVRADLRGALVWSLTGGGTRPAARAFGKTPQGIQPTAPPISPEEQQRQSADNRRKLLARFLEREEIAYDAGFRDGRTGAPHRPKQTELGPA